MNQAEVAFVQRAHRRHKSDGSVLFAAQPARDRHHALASVDDFHAKGSATKRRKIAQRGN